MADPLSITAGIIAVLQLTTTARQYLTDVKDAPAERQRILIEVVTVSGFLHTLKDLAESMQPNDLQGSALRSLNVPDGPLEQVKCALERLVSKIKPARGLKRVSTSLTWTLNKADVNNILASIERQKALFLLAMQNDHIGLTKAMNTEIAEIQYGVQELNIAQIDMKVAEALRWLSSTDPSSNHHSACEKHEPTTGDWLLKSNEFETWKNGSGGFLWLHGKAGSGKTILCSTVIEATKLHTATLSGAALAYFYFDFNDAEKQHVKGFICSLIAQISHSRPSAAEKVRDMYKSCQDGQQRPSTESLRKCLKGILHSGPDTFLVIDALDECTQREELLDLLEDICSWKLPKLKILTTSRSERDIEDVLSTLSTCICIQSAKIDSDIRLYVNTRLNSDSKLKKWSNNPDLAEEIRIALVNGADGMFRWVVCQMDALRKCLKPDAVRKALKALPKTLDTTYDRILNSIEEDYRKEAFSVLQWLAFSVRPMGLEEIAEAVSMAGEDHPMFDPGKRLFDPVNVVTICNGLITSTKRGEERSGLEGKEVVELRLAHFSVKEYLISQRIPAHFRIEKISANLCIAKTCLAYLLHFDSDLLSCIRFDSDLLSHEGVWDYPLLRYAAEFWPEHVRAITDGSSDTLLNSMTLDFLNPDKLCLLNWLRVYNPNGDFVLEVADSGSPLYYASSLGLCNITRALISPGVDVNAPGGQYGTALQAAARSGNETVIQLLLEAGADVNARGEFHGNALRAYRNQVTVHLLPETGADVNTQKRYYATALQQAAAHSRNETVIQLLLEAGADVNAQGGHYAPALQAAVESGNEAAIQLLLDAGADVNARGGKYGSALDAAIDTGHQADIDLLLANGAKTTAELESEREASFHSQSDDEGVSSDEENHSEEDPIHSANATPPPAESPENNPMPAI